MKEKISIAVLLLLAWQLSYCSPSRVVRSYIDAKSIQAAVNTLIADVGEKDTIENWPNILVKFSKPSKDWQGPYLRRVPIDPWGSQYALQIKNKAIVGVYSYGRNGIDENGQYDDVSSWAGYKEDIYFPDRKRNRILLYTSAVMVFVLLLFLLLKAYRAIRKRTI